jgi:Putative addiction module component
MKTSLAVRDLCQHPDPGHHAEAQFERRQKWGCSWTPSRRAGVEFTACSWAVPATMAYKGSTTVSSRTAYALIAPLNPIVTGDAEQRSDVRFLRTPEGWSIFMSMSTTEEQLAEQAMSLPSESRARLADLLVESLDADQLGPIDRLWVVEAKRRRNEVRDRGVQTVPGEEALRKVRDVLPR